MRASADVAKLLEAQPLSDASSEDALIDRMLSDIDYSASLPMMAAAGRAERESSESR